MTGSDHPHPSQGEELALSSPGAYRAKVFASRLNGRVRVIDHRASDPAGLAKALLKLAEARGLSKVYLKARPADAAGLTGAGFVDEGAIEGFFNGVTCRVLSAFLDPERAESSATPEEKQVLAELIERPVPTLNLELPPGYTSAFAGPGEAAELAALYKDVFGSYPFPIFDPEYLRKVMKTHVVFRIVRDHEGRLVAAASAETAPELGNAEMTDFATLPSERGKRLAMFLLEGLELEMSDRGIRNLYTLARSSIIGMNKVFHHLGYRFTGRLVKNCYIGGRFEDMLCWCKRIE
jgi:putative beta-lysine N-acetyltransferase